MLAVKFEGSLQDVLGQMREFIGLVTKDAPVAHPAPVAESTPPKQTTSKKVERVAEPVSSVPTSMAVSLDDVKAASVRLAKAKGRQTVVDLLKEFGAQSGADIKDEERAAYIQKVNALIPA